jgi:mono/diheme cytochrome c family protein
MLARRSIVLVLALIVIAQAAWIAYPHVREVVLPREESAAVRGRRVAQELGCFACHGPGGVGGVPNPGSEEDEVPAFTEQTQMMYVKTPEDLREYVLYGAPKRRLDDPDYVARMEEAAVRMPAYEGWLSAAQLEDLVAYLRATSGQIVPDDELAAKGSNVALELGCFACHGELGAGGVPNPGSLKGYVPSFWGEDYTELVESDDELRQWIREGAVPRIAEHPIGKRFFEGQRIKMPAYERFLGDGDLDALVAYVKWIHAGAWRPLLR